MSQPLTATAAGTILLGVAKDRTDLESQERQLQAAMAFITAGGDEELVKWHEFLRDLFPKQD